MKEKTHTTVEQARQKIKGRDMFKFMKNKHDKTLRFSNTTTIKSYTTELPFDPKRNFSNTDRNSHFRVWYCGSYQYTDYTRTPGQIFSGRSEHTQPEYFAVTLNDRRPKKTFNEDINFSSFEAADNYAFMLTSFVEATKKLYYYDNRQEEIIRKLALDGHRIRFKDENKKQS